MRKLVCYTRFSSDMQNPKSCEDQEFGLLGGICGWFLLVNVGFRREMRAVWAVTSPDFPGSKDESRLRVCKWPVSHGVNRDGPAWRPAKSLIFPRGTTGQREGSGGAGEEPGASGSSPAAPPNRVLSPTDSAIDPEFDARKGLDRLGIDHRHAVIIYDRAESGTKVYRDEFQRLVEMRDRGEIGTLVVDDQARLTRAGNAFQFIQDLVYMGGRFISTGEGIDTNQTGWELRVKVMELHNSTTILETGRRVRRGQEGRLRAGLTAGDYPYGYDSFQVNPDAIKSGRGPKPEKQVRIKESEAHWVREIFAWFLNGISQNAIARKLNQLSVPLGGRRRNALWEHRHIAAILANAKYIGDWSYGKTTTRRNSQGRTKQVPVPEDQWTVVDRPDLRIVDQAIWDRATIKLAEVKAAFGIKAGQKKRGRKAHYSDVYPTGLLNGLIFCGECGAKLHQRGHGKYIYLGCPTPEGCSMRSLMPIAKAKQVLGDFLKNLLLGTPGWLNTALASMNASLSQLSKEMPVAVKAAEQQLASVKAQIKNLVDGLAATGLESAAVLERLAELEATKKSLEGRIVAAKVHQAAPTQLPDRDWVMKQLVDLFAVFEEDTARAALLLKSVLGRVTAHRVLPPGKQRGYVQLRFKVNYWAAIVAILDPEAKSALAVAIPDVEDADGISPEFRLDSGGPTKMDDWGPKIAVMRAQGVHWSVIQELTGLGSGPAYVAWKRYVDHQAQIAEDESPGEGPIQPPQDDSGQFDAA